MSPSEPPTRMSDPSVSRYASTTHCCVASPPPRSAWIDGSATLTTEPSMKAIDEPRMLATSVQRATHELTEGAAPAVLSMTRSYGRKRGGRPFRAARRCAGQGGSGLGGGRGGLDAERDVQLLRRSAALDGHVHRLTGLPGGDGRSELVGRGDLLAVERGDDVAGLQAG